MKDERIFDVVFTIVSGVGSDTVTNTSPFALTMKNPCILPAFVTITKSADLPTKTYHVYEAEEEFAQVTVFSLDAPAVCGSLAFKPYLETTLIDGDD